MDRHAPDRPPAPGDQVEAVERFDQQGETPEPKAEEQGGPPDIDQGEGAGGGYTLLVEQWLDGVEGDPAYLLRNRFLMEEQRRMQPSATGGGLYEPRPW